MEKLLYLCFMENKTHNELYSLRMQVKYLNSLINELQSEVYKLRCCCQFSVPKTKKTKKEILQDELVLLKNKKNKTSKDRDNIYTLEMILKNLK